MSAKDGDGLAGLDEQRFVVFQRLERANNGVIAVPIAGGAAGASVNDEVLRALGNIRVEVVLQHAEGGFLGPSFAGELIAAGGFDGGVGPRCSGC